MKATALVAGRVLLGLAVIWSGLLASAPTSAHTPSVSIGCKDGLPSVTVDLIKYSAVGDNHVKVTADAHTYLSTDFAREWHGTVRIGSGYVNHAARVIVTAWDDPTGSQGYTKTFDLVLPPCKEHRDVTAPRASFIGPCEDPMYAARLDNSRSTVAVTFRWHRWDLGIHRVVVRTVAAHRVLRTAFRHVDGGSVMTVTAHGESLKVKRAAPGGTYADCPR